MTTRARDARPAKPPRTNLRAGASSFVGRSQELDRIATLFEESRLVTLLGPGGIGKTRLALRHAEARLPSLGRPGRGGVWFVDLTEATSLPEALATVASTLGMARRGGATERELADGLGREIGNLGPTLIVLDNLEQLSASMARVVGAWLELAPSARWLVTTRVVLGLAAECVLTLGPLALDDARTLFVERARRVRDLDASEADPAAVGDIVDAIDRMPLAIELAASRTRVLSTGELRRRLASRIDVLAGGTSERHASIHRVVLDSLSLLSPPVCRAFALASTLRNGFSLDAAEAVLGAASLGPAAVFESFDVLLRSSLLRVEHEAGAPARYGFFETIREVAEQVAQADPARGAVRAAHADHYAKSAARARASEEASSAAVLLERDLDNLLAAAATLTALAREEPSSARAHDAATIVLAAEPLLSRRGQSSARERWLSEVLETLAAAGDSARTLRAEVLLGRGVARRELGETEGARGDFEAALASCGPDDTGLRALALMRLGDVDDLRGDTARARERMEESLTLLAATRQGAIRSAREAEALVRLGHTHRREGALDAAHTAISGAARRWRALGDDEGLASALYELGIVEMFRGNTDSAFTQFDEGLSVARRGVVPIMEGACLTARGCLLQDLGRLDEALTHHATAATIFRDRGSALREGSALHYLATTYLERGEPAEAAMLLEQARVHLVRVGAPRYDVLTRGARAVALAALGHGVESRIELAEATKVLALVPDEPALEAVIAIHHGTVAVACEGSSPITLDEARSLVRASPTDDSRFALRELERTVRQTPAAEAKQDALRVWGAGEAFSLPGGSRVEIPPRSPMRRILDHLVTRRGEAPGEPVAVDEIIRIGWPGDKASADAALNRAYVALATLRKRGLRDAIVRVGGGYAISRAVRVERVAPRHEAADEAAD